MAALDTVDRTTPLSPHLRVGIYGWDSGVNKDADSKDKFKDKVKAKDLA